MSVYILREFVGIREKLAANSANLKRLAEIDHTLLIRDASLRDSYQTLKPLIAPPPPAPTPPKHQLGFHP